MDVESWLRDMGLERYTKTFRENDINAAVLPKLTPEDLKDLGVTTVGHRRLLLDAIEQLPKTESATVSEKPAAAPRISQSKAERRYLTVMFVDLVGSTQLSASLDPEDMRGVIRAYQNAVAGSVARFDGHIAKFMGDGVLVYFGWPKAHEDEAERAVRVGLDLVETVSVLKATEGSKLAIRIGIATGLVVVGDLIGEREAEENAVVGETPNLAARLQSLVGPNQIIVSEATGKLLSRNFELVEIEPQELKGIGEPVRAFLVEGELDAGSRFEARSGLQPTALLGRDQEIALLLERWDRAKSSEGQGVLLLGEAGIGKSRITSAVSELISAEDHTLILLQCSPYHSDVALWPMVQHFTRAAKFDPVDPNERKLAKLTAIVGNELALLMANFLDVEAEKHADISQLSPQVRRTRTLDALVSYMEKLAERDQILLIVEDAHWIDPTTRELLDLLLHRLASKPAVLLITSRHEGAPDFHAHPHLTRLTLNRLGRDSVEVIVQTIGGDQLTAEAVEEILNRTDGVPLFAEEMTKAVLDVGDARIPATLHDGLMARLDRTEDAKAIAQIASCIGREFELSVVSELADKPNEALQNAMDRLVSAELVFQHGSPPQATYTFKHALVRDAAYESILRSERVEIHRRLGSFLEQELRRGADVAPELIAQHFFAAGETERCIEYWLMAGQLARARYANLEAAVSFARALEELRKTMAGHERDRRELDLRLAASGPTIASAGYTSPQVKENSDEIVRLARRLGDKELLWRALYDLVRNAIQKPDVEAVRIGVAEIATIAEELNSNCARFAAAYPGSGIPLLQGRLRAAKDSVDRLASIEVPVAEEAAISDHFQAVIGLNFATAWIYLLLGYPDTAQRFSESGLRRSHDMASPFAKTFALQRTAIFAVMARNQHAALKFSDECLAMLEAYPLPHWQPWVLIVRAWAHAMAGRRAEARADLADAWSKWHTRRSEFFGSFFRCVSAEAFLKLGDAERGDELIREAEALSNSLSEHFWRSELLRLKARLRLATKETPTKAEELLRSAIDVARDQDAKLLQLRASLDLARYLMSNGARLDAELLLKPQLLWFKEGSDMSDLVMARSILDDPR